MTKIKSGGGLQAITYTISAAKRHGFWRLWKAMRSKNACKTCALGMGGQKGGMTNELNHFPEFCKKSIQATTSDLQKPIAESFFDNNSIDQIQKMTPRELESLGRIPFPLVLSPGSKHYVKISWEEAFSKISSSMTNTDPEQSFFYFSGRSSNEAGFLLQLMARLYGTNHINNCSYYCHQASGVGLTSSIGSGTATVSVDDMEHADCFLLFGGNPTSNHPRLMSALMRMRRRGGKVIVINPVFEPGLQNFKVPSDPMSLLFGSDIASLYLQPNIGSDIAVMVGMSKYLLANDKIDFDFLDRCTEGWADLKQTIEATSWEDIVSSTGLAKDQIESAAKIYGQSKAAIISWTMGLTHHLHGVENIQWTANLALLRGMVGRPSAGLLPLRGHSNVQGMGSIGVTPQLKKSIFKRWEQNGIPVPKSVGLDTMGCMEKMDQGQMKFAFCLGGNLYGANPDLSFAGQSFSKLDTVVYLNTTLNNGHAFGLAKETIILPVQARDEESQKTTQESMFSYVRLSDGGQARVTNISSEVEVISEVAKRVLPQQNIIDWDSMQNHDTIRQWIAKLIPGLEKIADIEKKDGEFRIPGRRLRQEKFPTDSGKAKLHSLPLPDIGYDANKYLKMMTVRSEGQFNTVVYEEADLYRGQTSRDVVLINPTDMSRLGLKEGQRVKVKNETGEMNGIEVKPWNIKSGSALMYYPEANILVPRDVDPVSKTPAYKSVLISLE